MIFDQLHHFFSGNESLLTNVISVNANTLHCIKAPPTCKWFYFRLRSTKWHFMCRPWRRSYVIKRNAREEEYNYYHRPSIFIALGI